MFANPLAFDRNSIHLGFCKNLRKFKNLPLLSYHHSIYITFDPLKNMELWDLNRRKHHFFIVKMSLS